VNVFPDPLLLRKSDSAGNRTQDLWVCSQEFSSVEHDGGPSKDIAKYELGNY
jgi:hypothetical protein